MKFENLGVVVGFWSKSGGFDVIVCTYSPVSIRKQTQARIIENCWRSWRPPVVGGWS